MQTRLTYAAVLLALGLARVNAQSLPPPSVGGSVEIEVVSGTESLSRQDDYLPAKPYTILAETIGRSVYPRMLQTFTPAASGSVTSTFTFDDGYADEHPEVEKPIRGVGFSLRGSEFRYREIVVKTDWDSNGQPTFELTAAAKNGPETYRIEGKGEGRILDRGFGRGPTAFPWPRFYVGDVTKVEGNVGWFAWTHGFLYRHLRGINNYWTVLQPDGSVAVFHHESYSLVAPTLGEFQPIGAIVSSGTPGHRPRFGLTVEPLTAGGAYSKLREANWTFSDNFKLTTDAGAHYAFSEGGASASKLRYKLQVQPGLERTITWMETFTPEGASEPTDRRFLSETVTADATATQAYTIDPFARAGNQPGHYRVEAFESDSFEATLTADTNGDGALLPASGPMTDHVIAHADTVSATQPYQLLANLDDDGGDGAPDAFDGQVDGPDDLADFFPVFLNIKSLLASLPFGVVCKLSQADGALNFIYTDLKQYNAFSFRNDPWGYAYGPGFDQAAAEATVLPITQEGVSLSEDFLNRIRNDNQGVILIEARFSSSAPLVLTFETGTGVALVSLPLRAVGISIAVDANRDGEIKFASEDASDATSADSPYRFWLNDDIDRVHTFADSNPDSMETYTETEEDDIGPEEAARDSLTEDGGLNHFADSKRDLEDFSRMQLVVAELVPALARGDLFVGLKWANKPAGNATMRIYENVSAGGGLGYLTSESEAAAQKNKVAILDNRYAGEPQLWLRTMVASETDPYILPSYLFQNLSATNTRVHLLFEAVGHGKGEIKPVLLMKNGTQYAEIASGSGVWMDFKTIGDMYEHWSVGNAAGGEPDAVAARVASETGDPTPFSYTATSPEELTYVLFVHGWNMEKWEKERFAETAYKRLWWQGYKGRFGLFTWPCTNRFDETKPFKKLGEGITDGTNFDRGEWTAWRSGVPLRQLLQTLNGAYSGQLHVFSHSMGGIVMSEALRLQSDAGGGQLANVYVASQAALSAHVYDGTLSTATGSTNAVQWEYDHPSFAFLGINPGPQNYGPQTPNIYKNWCAYLLSGGATSSSAVVTLVNFYNQNDYALSAPVWQFNQITKPDWPDTASQPWTYDYAGDPTVFNDVFIKTEGDLGSNQTALHLGTRTNPQDRHEIMAFAAESYVKSLGATPGVLQGITRSTDLRSINSQGELIWPVDGGDHKAHIWHSGQFRSTIQRQRMYWKTLLGADGFQISTTTLP